MSKEQEYKFIGRIVRCIWSSDDFKVYAMEVDKDKYPKIKRNKFKNVSISGELSDLTLGVEYEVVGIESPSKYGMGYKVLNIRRDVPKSADDMFLFLEEILTPNQAKVLFENYPDIVQRVKENRLDDINFSKLKGIKERSFEKIKGKIIENFCLADLVVEFQGYLNLSIIKKIYNKYTSVERIREQLNSNPYKCLCGLAGVGFVTADSILLDIEKLSNKLIADGKKPIVEFAEDLATSCQRCVACALHILEQNESEGHTKMDLAELRSQLLKVVPACADHFVAAMQSPQIYYNKDRMEVSLVKTYRAEQSIARTILKNLKRNENVWDFNVEKYRIVNGAKLSDEQIQAVKNVCANSISILNGAGGTGKSFSTQAVIAMLKEHGKSFKLFSPTGKAAKVLADYTKETASTIHRGLCYSVLGYEYHCTDDKGNTYTEYTNWGFNKHNKLKTDIVIVDEFSMVDIWLFKRLLEAIDFEETKLLMIGDNAQLCSVGCGNLLHDFMESKIIPTVTLTKVFRYGEGGLMKVATDVRFCKQYLSNDMKSKVTTFGQNSDYTFIDMPSERIPQNAVALYKKLLQKGYTINDIQVLTAKNIGDCGAIVLNNMIQKVANKNCGCNINMKYGETTYYVGDLIIQKANNYKAEIQSYSKKEYEDEYYVEDFESNEKPTAFIANGETGIVVDIQNSYMLIDFDGIIVKYNKADLLNVGLGYAISIHKSQGSSIRAVILLTPQSHTFMLNSNLIYVGLTRMKEVCYHLGTLSAVNMAVKKKANLSRNTFMQGLLAAGLDDIVEEQTDLEWMQMIPDEPDDNESSHTESYADGTDDDDLPWD